MFAYLPCWLSYFRARAFQPTTTGISGANSTLHFGAPQERPFACPPHQCACPPAIPGHTSSPIDPNIFAGHFRRPKIPFNFFPSKARGSFPPEALFNLPPLAVSLFQAMSTFFSPTFWGSVPLEFFSTQKPPRQIPTLAFRSSFKGLFSIREAF